MLGPPCVLLDQKIDIRFYVSPVAFQLLDSLTNFGFGAFFACPAFPDVSLSR